MFLDAARYLYAEELGLRARLLKPLASLYYKALASLGDRAVSVSDDIVKRLGARADTVRGTFMLSASAADADTEDIAVEGEGILYSGPLDVARALLDVLWRSGTKLVITGPLAYFAREYFKDDGRVVLCHNIGDKALEALHRKIRAAVVFRRAMTGISMTIVQELYFDRPVIANRIAVRGLEDAPVVVATTPAEMAEKLRRVDKMEGEESGSEFFERELSPPVFFRRISRVYEELLS